MQCRNLLHQVSCHLLPGRLGTLLLSGDNLWSKTHRPHQGLWRPPCLIRVPLRSLAYRLRGKRTPSFPVRGPLLCLVRVHLQQGLLIFVQALLWNLVHIYRSRMLLCIRALHMSNRAPDHR
ncbi:hypothetical protein HPB47_002875 [Ixodes persulcatus]|uniref:Uncharacterized protein n=1 Tax=Ixodes persulcatus TaxID=34615 RepID=A0AC60PL51_IXOPE|nr:hypothetical protein HPB47_002875 [Ixodes persulcatus]